jgi:MoxR-like ATPase
VQDRDYVIPDDIKHIAQAALGHRIILGADVAFQGTDPGDIIHEIMGRMPVPIAG